MSHRERIAAATRAIFGSVDAPLDDEQRQTVEAVVNAVLPEGDELHDAARAVVRAWRDGKPETPHSERMRRLERAVTGTR